MSQHPPPNPLPSKPPVGLYGGNVLVQSPTRWDEACFLVPAVRAIRGARPSCTLGILCHESQEAMWQCVAGINDVVTWNDRGKINQRRMVNWESAILWEKNAGADFCKSLNLKQRLGYPVKELKRHLTGDVNVALTVGPTQHRVQHYLSFMERLHIPTMRADYFSPVKMNVPQVPSTVLLAPDSDYGSHYEWEIEKWIKIYELLTQHLSAKVLIAKFSDHKKSLSSLLQQAVHAEHTLFLDSFHETLPIIASHSLTITADSSLAHISAFTGVTTVTLFGPNDPDWKRPLGKQHTIVRKKVECSPCLLKKCRLDLRCQRELDYENVATAILKSYVLE